MDIFFKTFVFRGNLKKENEVVFFSKKKLERKLEDEKDKELPLLILKKPKTFKNQETVQGRENCAGKTKRKGMKNCTVYGLHEMSQHLSHNLWAHVSGLLDSNSL